MSHIQLTYEERCHIEKYLQASYTQSAIAIRLKRSPSSISREIARNSASLGFYSASYAQVLSRERKHIQGREPKKIKGTTKKRIVQMLQEDWSPEQISGRLAINGVSISLEAIYQFIIRDKANGGELYKHLRHSGKRRYKKRVGHKNRILGKVSIHERPPEIDARETLGHWEIDTVCGQQGKPGYLVTVVERVSRLTRMTKVHSKRSHEVALATFKRLRTIRDHVHSITADNGTEFSLHEHISNGLAVDFYFADPYSPWQRGTNENTNGLIRQYLRKGEDFSMITDEAVRQIENRLNNRPRKCLGFKTPYEVMSELLNQGVAIPT